MHIFNNLNSLLSCISKKRRFQLLLLFACMLLGAITEMAALGSFIPFLAIISGSSQIFEKYPFLKDALEVIAFKNENLFLVTASIFAIITLISTLVRIFLTWISLRFSSAIGSDLGVQLFSNTLYQSYSWHLTKNSSDIISSLDRVNSVVYGIISPLLQGLTSFFISIGILSIILFVDYKISLICGAFFIILYGLSSLLIKSSLIKNGHIISNNLSKRIKIVQEGFGGIRDIILDGTQKVYIDQFSTCDQAMRNAQANNGLFGLIPRYIVEFGSFILLIFLSYFMGLNDSTGISAAIPILGTFALGAQKLLPQMQIIYYSWSCLVGNQSQLSDVLSNLELNCKINRSNLDADFPSMVSVLPTKTIPLISLNNLSFKFKDTDLCILRSINLSIYQGMKIGVVGRTGSGKSTLLDLIMGLLEPSLGSIEVNGNVLNRGNVFFWQRQISHVPQSIYLSDTTIYENIAFGVPYELIDKQRVYEASSNAILTDFVKSLPNGYNTVVGERGVRLSGGQRQRIGLARALYKKSKVIVLDEATSALDSQTEREIINNISNLDTQVTILMIAHRLSTLQDCDFIIELSNGFISRHGTYKDLF